MDTPLATLHRPIARLCRLAPVRTVIRQRPLSSASRALRSKAKSTPQTQTIYRVPRASPTTDPVDTLANTRTAPAVELPHISLKDPDVVLAQKLSYAILQDHGIPQEQTVTEALQAIETAARKVVGVKADPTQSTDDGTPASALLSLDSRPVSPESQRSVETIDVLSKLAHKLTLHPSIFITPTALSTYVTIQSLLLRPASLPEVFTLYAEKPAAVLAKDGKTTTYETQNPSAIAAAIPSKLANLALSTAIHAHSLPTALSIINTTYRTPSFQRAKLFRGALPPFVGACLAPVAAYTLASTFANYQTNLPPETFTSIAFAGMLTYTAAVGTIGYVALTTSNDQMERVTWATGMPLWERWAREEERAAVDRVALAWGFRERWRWGEEEGLEWDGLRDWVGVRGMVLDKVGLMEGME